MNEEGARIIRIRGNVDAGELTKTVQKTMWEQVGVVRDRSGLRDAIAEFERIKNEKAPRLSGSDIFAALEASNLLQTAEIVAWAALTWEETTRTQICNDYPASDDNN
ncbi:MAG: hypothetical protein JSW12_02345 [Deltaproteobacteria bacterium]|nr:MAG: hypothetical protein JSW12_02345 [Deltaproteobacteria bacterium]